MTFQYNKLAWACTAYLLGCTPLLSQAQTQTQSAKNSTTAIDTIVVSGSRSASKLSETAASIGVVNRAQ
jgi:outer membrane cobalamin receptor